MWTGDESYHLQKTAMQMQNIFHKKENTHRQKPERNTNQVKIPPRPNALSK